MTEEKDSSWPKKWHSILDTSDTALAVFDTNEWVELSDTIRLYGGVAYTASDEYQSSDDEDKMWMPLHLYIDRMVDKKIDERLSDEIESADGESEDITYPAKNPNAGDE